MTLWFLSYRFITAVPFICLFQISSIKTENREIDHIGYNTSNDDFNLKMVKLILLHDSSSTPAICHFSNSSRVVSKLFSSFDPLLHKHSYNLKLPLKKNYKTKSKKVKAIEC